jgi:G3E family GTPase
VIHVIDVENWAGYSDTSYTAKIQARYTDLIVFNKWEVAGEQRMEECLDR